MRHLAAVPDQPTLDDVARAAAWAAFKDACKTPTLTPTDRLRRYAEACLVAGETHTRAQREDRTG